MTGNKIVIGIIKGMAEALKAAFPDAAIYAEEVEQGLREPCFFILPLTNRYTPLLGRRYRMDYTFEVRYFPKRGSYQAAGSIDLSSALEWITADGCDIQGTGMSGQVSDGVLVFTVSYKTLGYRDRAEADYMEDLKHSEGVKEYGG